MAVTYIGGWALVSAGAGESDKLMASLVHDKTADCKREKKGRRKGRREVERRKRGKEREEIIKTGTSRQVKAASSPNK